MINVFNQPDNASLNLGSVDALTTAEIAGTTYLFAVNFGELGGADGALSVFGIAADGTLVFFADVEDAGAGFDSFEFDGASSVTTAVVGGNTFVIVGGQQDLGISVFRVDTTGLTINGTSGNDTIDDLNSAPGQLLASDLGDQIFGFAGNDTLEGLGGGDTLIGGKGKDLLTGDLGADIFDFNKAKESVKGAQRDVITDFDAVNDVIDLRDIDARAGVAGNQKFKFIAGQKFHDVKGELHFVKKAGFVIVEGDVNGDGRADFQIEVHNATNDLATLAKGDFIL